jgi:hypothetical protein
MSFLQKKEGLDGEFAKAIMTPRKGDIHEQARS